MCYHIFVTYIYSMPGTVSSPRTLYDKSDLSFFLFKNCTLSVLVSNNPKAPVYGVGMSAWNFCILYTLLQVNMDTVFRITGVLLTDIVWVLLSLGKDCTCVSIISYKIVALETHIWIVVTRAHLRFIFCYERLKLQLGTGFEYGWDTNACLDE